MVNWDNPEEVREYHRKYYNLRRERMIKWLGGECARCGSQDNLQFDHKDPANKEREFKEMLVIPDNMNDEQREEWSKAQLLCEPCHVEKSVDEKEDFTHGTIYAWMRKGCRCVECLPAWRKWHDKRNAKRRKSDSSRGPYNLPASCGTAKKYKRGCRCDDCKAANAAKARAYRKKKQEQDS